MLGPVGYASGTWPGHIPGGGKVMEVAIKVAKAVVDRIVKDTLERAAQVVGDPLVQAKAMDLVREVGRSWGRSVGPAPA